MMSGWTIMANLALLAFASVTATPLSSVMDRIASISGSEHVISTMREVEISDRNLDTWWADFASQIADYEQSITYDASGTDGIKTESPEGDEIVCKDAGYVGLLSTLGNIMEQWEKVEAGWEEKNALLNYIWNHLTSQDDDAVESGLHCNEGASGDSLSLCNFITGLMDKTAKEKKKLEKEKAEVDGYIADINDYKCDCKMGEWAGDFSPCDGYYVLPKTIYGDCSVNQVFTNADCEPIQSSCGTGTQFKTRSRIWDSKAGGAGEPKVPCKTGLVDQQDPSKGTLLEISSEQQQLVRTCKAGKYDGNCPVDCVWSAWNPPNIRDAMCGATSCTDKTNNKHIATRRKTSLRAYGGKYCFQDEEGDYETKEERCTYEKRVEQEKEDLTDEIALLKTKVSTLTAAMCIDTNGPCKNEGICEVELNMKNDEVTKWCTCPSGFTGTFCEEEEQCLTINGEKCIFPFIHESTTYNGCYRNTCPTALWEDNRPKFVGTCSESCPKQG